MFYQFMINLYTNNTQHKSQLKQNMRTAEAVLREFKQEHPYLRSNTFVQTRITENLDKPYLKALYDGLKRLQNKNDSIVSNLRKDMNASLLATKEDYLLLEKQLLKKAHAGNCDECADMIQYALQKQNIKNHIGVQKVALKAYDGIYYSNHKAHAFNIIGLKKTADLANPKTWGNNAVIIDGWKNMYGKAMDMLEYYKQLFNIEANETVQYSESKNRFLPLIKKQQKSQYSLIRRFLKFLL